MIELNSKKPTDAELFRHHINTLPDVTFHKKSSENWHTTLWVVNFNTTTFVLQRSDLGEKFESDKFYSYKNIDELGVPTHFNIFNLTSIEFDEIVKLIESKIC